MSDIQHLTLPADGDKPARRLAYRLTLPAESAANPDAKVLVFLPGYMSDMAGSKATMLFDAAREQGVGCLLLDYSGCGASDGDFADGTLSRWREEVLALIAALVPGPVVLVGSSMGGWLMLLVALALPAGRLAGIMGIAAAPDFTQWGYTSAQKGELIAGRTIFEPNPYGPEPTPTHARFWTDGEHNRLLDADIPLDVPVVLVHGQRDEDVPWEISLRLSATLRSDAVQLCLVKDGDHRLSRPVDLALIRRMALALAGADA